LGRAGGEGYGHVFLNREAREVREDF
jgi:hypothetical protein